MPDLDSAVEELDVRDEELLDLDEGDMEDYIEEQLSRERDFSVSESSAFLHGYDEGQAEVALNILLQLPEELSRDIVADLAHRMKWALVSISERDVLTAWKDVYTEPPTDEDMDELFTQAFWPVWVEAEMRITAYETLYDLIAPDPSEPTEIKEPIEEPVEQAESTEQEESDDGASVYDEEALVT